LLTTVMGLLITQTTLPFSPWSGAGLQAATAGFGSGGSFWCLFHTSAAIIDKTMMVNRLQTGFSRDA
jgi:hypothetical protein